MIGLSGFREVHVCTPFSQDYQYPYLIKDTFKEALCAGVPINSREESSRFSAATFDAMMYVTERLFETGSPVLIEGNFMPAGIKKTDEAGTIKGLIDKYAYEPLTYEFTGDTQVLYKQFIEREKLPERGRANQMLSEPSYSDFCRICHNFNGFYVGGNVIKIDTTDFDHVDFEKYIEMARLFMNS